MGFSPPSGGGSGGGLTSFNGRTAPAVIPTTGDYTAAQVTNAADKASGTTQAFTATITSNGNIGGQRIISSRLTTSAFIGRHDGGAPPAGTYVAGDWSTDYTTPGIWMTSVGGVNPGDWENLITGLSNAGLALLLETFTSTLGIDMTDNSSSGFDLNELGNGGINIADSGGGGEYLSSTLGIRLTAPSNGAWIVTATNLASLPTPAAPQTPSYGLTQDGGIYFYPTGGPWRVIASPMTSAIDQLLTLQSFT